MFGLSGSGAVMGPASGWFDPPLPRDPEEPPAPVPPELPAPELPPALLPPPFAPLPLSPALPPPAPLVALAPFDAPPDALPAPPDAFAAASPFPVLPRLRLESEEPQAIRMLMAGKTDRSRERGGIVVFE